MRPLPTQQVRPGEVPDQERRMLPQETRSNPVWILSGVAVTAQERLQERIDFLREQLDSLDHYLPETYQFLMAELDSQQRELIEHKINDLYSNQSNEHQDPITTSGDQTESQESDHWCYCFS